MIFSQPKSSRRFCCLLPREPESVITKSGRKQAFDWPLALAAVSLRMNGSKVKSARVVLGYVAPVPWISLEAERALAGKEISEAVAANAGEAALHRATPLSHNAYKVQLARVALKRAVLKAASGGAA